MRVLAWITETGWEASVDAAAMLPAGEITLLYVSYDDFAHAVELLGRRRRDDLDERLAAVAEPLLEAAAERLGREARRVAATGAVEHVVTEAAAEYDVLVVARDDVHPGPHSIRHPTRFVVDHAPCTVVLAWPEQ